MRTKALVVLFIVAFAIAFTFTSLPATFTLNVDVALAQQSVPDKPVLAQDTPKGATPAAITTSPAIDPKLLIGTWQGTWSSKGALGDKFYLTIKSVQDSKIVGSVYIYSRAHYANKDLPINGSVTPEGILHLSNEHTEFSLTMVSPGKMEGAGRAGVYAIVVTLYIK